jgi:hypothetical protein
MCHQAKITASTIANEYNISQRCIEMIYMLPNPNHDSFDELIDLQHYDLSKHQTAGLSFIQKNGCVILAHLIPSTPGAKIPQWRTQLHGAWLTRIGDQVVYTIKDAQLASKTLQDEGHTHATLLFAHPEVHPDISPKVLLIVSMAPFTQLIHEQLSNCWEFSTVAEHLHKSPNELVNSGQVLNVVTWVMPLSRGKLLKQPNWDEWQALEFLQLDQYDTQGMFGSPVTVDSEAAVFHSVWTYAIKALDGQKKARWTCDGSKCLGQAQILDETYANCVNQTSSHLFYTIAAVENLLIFGADISNAFAEAPPPKQGFYIYPDKAFHDWCVKHKQRPPIPPGHVIPILLAMQGHLEAPHLWEKHVDAILHKLGLIPTVHKPCLHCGIVNGKWILLKRQVDNFAIAAPDAKTANILLDMLDDKLTIPIK